MHILLGILYTTLESLTWREAAVAEAKPFMLIKLEPTRTQDSTFRENNWRLTKEERLSSSGEKNIRVETAEDIGVWMQCE